MSSGRIVSYLLVSIALRCALLPGQSAPVADDAVINQTGAGFPETWGENGGQKVPAYYTLKTDSPEKVAAGLRALPRISLSMDLDDLFGADKGIYAHPMETGTNWERRASMEMTYPGNGSKQYCMGFETAKRARSSTDWRSSWKRRMNGPKKIRRRFVAKSATSKIIVTICIIKRWKKQEHPWEAEPLSLWENSFNADFEAVDNFGAAPA